jgi:DNA-binding response OmpR family regulator
VDAFPSVLVVDPAGASSIAAIVKRCGFCVTWSATPEEALFELGQHHVGAVVAVLPLAGFGLTGLCQEIRLRGNIPLLVVTNSDDVDWIDALSEGADDHLRAPFEDRELRARLLALIRRMGGPLSPRRLVRVGTLVVRLGRGDVVLEPAVDLSPVQRRLLGYLAGQPGVVLSETALADGIRAAHGPISAEQLDGELGRLRAAIDLASGVDQAIEYIEGAGWRLGVAAG